MLLIHTQPERANRPRVPSPGLALRSAACALATADSTHIPRPTHREGILFALPKGEATRMRPGIATMAASLAIPDSGNVHWRASSCQGSRMLNFSQFDDTDRPDWRHRPTFRHLRIRWDHLATSALATLCRRQFGHDRAQTFTAVDAAPGIAWRPG